MAAKESFAKRHGHAGQPRAICHVAKHGDALRGPRFPDKNDPIPYCALDNAPKIIRSEGLQGSAPEDKSSHKKWPEQNWGIAAGVRVARIPFDTKGDTVTSVVPQLYYEDDLTFLRGLEGGIKITGANAWQLNALGRLRFFDIPKRFQNEIQEDTVDLGLQLRYLPWANAFVEWELLSDQDFRFHSKHHRSAIFETASHFRRIKGGSNYNTVYLQWHF